MDEAPETCPDCGSERVDRWTKEEATSMKYWYECEDCHWASDTMWT